MIKGMILFKFLFMKLYSLMVLLMMWLRFDFFYRRDYGYGDCGWGGISVWGIG